MKKLFIYTRLPFLVNCKMYNLKQTALILICFFTINISFGQNISLPLEYIDQIKKADTFYDAKDYKRSALCYTAAFNTTNEFRWEDHYNAACSWALANVPDSAFFHLNFIVAKVKFSDYDLTVKDTDLNSLQVDKRWLPLLEMIKKNKVKKE